MINDQLSSIFSSCATAIRSKGVEGRFRPDQLASAIGRITSTDSGWKRPQEWPRIDLIDVSDYEQLVFIVDMEDDVDKPWLGFKCALKSSAFKWLLQELDVNEDGTYSVISSQEYSHNASSPSVWITDNGNRFRTFRIISSSDAPGAFTSVSWTQSPVLTATDNPRLVGLTYDRYRVSFIKEFNIHVENIKAALPSTAFSNHGSTYPEHMIYTKCRFDTYYGWWHNSSARKIDVIDPIFISYTTSGRPFDGAHLCEELNVIITDPAWEMPANYLINGMYYTDYALKSVDLSWLPDQYKPGAVNAMFQSCYSLRRINGLNRLDTSDVTSYGYVFSGCQQLEDIDISTWRFSNVTSLAMLFNSCFALKRLKLGHVEEAQNVTTMQGMFYGCYRLKELDLHDLVSPNCTNFKQMFYTCFNLNWLDISSMDFSKATDVTDIFNGCTQLERVKWPTDIKKGFNTSLFFSTSTLADHDTLVGLLNILQDMTGKTAQKLTIGTTNLNKLTVAEKAIATNKNWTLA